jgi:hypothetical protein
MSGQLHAPGALPRGKSPRYPLERRTSVPQNRSGGRGENSWPYQHSNTDPSVVQPVASRYTDCAIPAAFSLINFVYYLDEIKASKFVIPVSWSTNVTKRSAHACWIWHSEELHGIYRSSPVVMVVKCRMLGQKCSSDGWHKIYIRFLMGELL